MSLGPASTGGKVALVRFRARGHSGAMPRPLPSVLVIALLSLVSPAPAAGAGAVGPVSWPVDAPVIVRTFQAPLTTYGVGHRGIDLRAPAGTTVHAIAAGTVHFSGVVAGVPTVSIAHREMLSTYQPVSAIVHRGDHVSRGDAIGRVSDASVGVHEQGVLHFGLRESTNQRYVNPLNYLGFTPRLVPRTFSHSRVELNPRWRVGEPE